MLTKILIGLTVVAVLLIAFSIVVALQPSSLRVSRTALIAAPPAEVFAHVNNLRKWQAWSPYDKRDPHMNRTYEGPEEGSGASYVWNGNSEVGEGRSTIVESRPDELIEFKLEFVRPFAGTNTARFTFQPQGEQTAVTWALDCNCNFCAKAMGLFISMDKMIGNDFEGGLANLKKVVESEGSPQVAVR
jgi:uncharacterized protein YndB with AHSA1/START domain